MEHSCKFLCSRKFWGHKQRCIQRAHLRPRPRLPCGLWIGEMPLSAPGVFIGVAQVLLAITVAFPAHKNHLLHVCVFLGAQCLCMWGYGVLQV